VSERAPMHMLPLFDVAPDIRTAAPSVPTRSSEAAADMITNSPLRRASWRKILLYLASQDRPVSREELSEAIGVPQHSLCARIAELRPTWVECAPQTCRAKSGIMVDGYALTPSGRERVARAQTEPIR
jgi:hypothetical protein